MWPEELEGYEHRIAEMLAGRPGNLENSLSAVARTSLPADALPLGPADLEWMRSVGLVRAGLANNLETPIYTATRLGRRVLSLFDSPHRGQE